MVRQATRYSVISGHQEFVAQNPGVQMTVDNSVYFVRMQLHEPADGSSHLSLGNWEEILTDDEQAAGVTAARSKDNFDEGLYCKNLVQPQNCTSNIRLAKINFKHWPIIVFTNFIGKYPNLELTSN